MICLKMLVSWFLLIGGAAVCVIGAIGCLKFPSFYTKLHALSVSDSFGIPIALLGIAVMNGLTLISLKILFVIFILLLTSSLSTHVLMRAGIRNKIPFDDDTKIKLTQ